MKLYNCEFCKDGKVDYQDLYGGPPAPNEEVICEACKKRFKEWDKTQAEELLRKLEEL
jgi:hypothetical protein